MIRIDARNSKALRDIIVALNGAERSIQKNVRQFTKSLLVPEWKEALAAQGTNALESQVLVSTATAAVSNQNIRLSSATKGKPLRGGLAPKVEYAAVEFGTKKRGKKIKYLGRKRKASGTTYYEINRRTAEQLKPYKKTGYVFYPAVKKFVPRAAALWAQTTVKVLALALEGKKDG